MIQCVSLRQSFEQRLYTEDVLTSLRFKGSVLAAGELTSIVIPEVEYEPVSDHDGYCIRSLVLMCNALTDI